MFGFFTFAPMRICDVECMVGGLGSPGEPGLEILMPRPAATELWELLARRARPAGFAAADILRIEAGFVLFVDEICLSVAARAAFLGRFAGLCGAPGGAESAPLCFLGTTRRKHGL